MNGCNQYLVLLAEISPINNDGDLFKNTRVLRPAQPRMYHTQPCVLIPSWFTRTRIPNHRGTALLCIIATSDALVGRSATSAAACGEWVAGLAPTISSLRTRCNSPPTPAVRFSIQHGATAKARAID